MFSRSLTSYTSGGLGNRMRALLGSLSLAKLQSRKFYYVWDQDEKFSAPVTALWQFPYPVANKTLARVARKLGARQYDEDLQDLNSANLHRHIQIKTIYEMRHPLLKEQWRAEMKALVPTDTVRDRVTGTWSKGLDKGPYVGVMIRAHQASHEITKQHSPLDWFLNRMDELSSLNTDTVFFVSTDSPEAQHAIQKRFDRVVVQSDKGEYNSREGLQSAVADLYLLASSSYMLKPYWSSFPEMAEALAGPVLLVEHSMSAGPGIGTIMDRASPADPLRPSMR